MKTWPVAGLGLGNSTLGIQPAAASEPRLSLWSWGGGGASRKYRGAIPPL